MIDREKLEKRILEEYENFVFQGYTTAEISYIGTCLQRWAIEISPSLMLAMHGYLCLALRHPGTKSLNTRSMVVDFVKQLGENLVKLKLITPEALRECQKIEAKEGSPDLG